LKVSKVSHILWAIFPWLQLCNNFGVKMVGTTFWAIHSQTHLVTLAYLMRCKFDLRIGSSLGGLIQSFKSIFFLQVGHEHQALTGGAAEVAVPVSQVVKADHVKRATGVDVMVTIFYDS
jgi:hypothetical protein